MYLAAVIALAIGLFVGHSIREIKDKLEVIRFKLSELKTDKEVEKKPETTFVGEMSRAEMQALAQEEIKQLNEVQ